MTRRHFTWLVIGVLAVSSSAVLVRLTDAPPIAIAFYRCTMAAAILWPLALFRERPALRAMTSRQLRLSLLSGAFLALHFAVWVPSLSYTSVAASTVLVTMSPLWVAVLGPLVGERMSRRTLVGVFVALAGTAVIAGGAVSGSGRALFGDALAIAGGAAAAAYVVAGRHLRQELPLLPYVSVVYTVAAVMLAAVMFVAGTPFAGYPSEVWLLFGAMTIGPQLLGHTVFNLLLAEVSATVVVVAIMAEPVGATVLAFIVLHEVPSVATLVGGAVVLAGVYLAIAAQAHAHADADAVPVEAPLE